MSSVGEPRVDYVLLYRAQREWRTTVSLRPKELACGALPQTPVSEPFDSAADEFAGLLKAHWGVEGPIEWQEIRPDWWGADLVPGALEEAGETSG